MQRTPEPAELMDDPAQARAYATADFEAPHAAFIDGLQQRYPALTPTRILEPGCGSGDISWRLAQHYPAAVIDAIDGSAAMLNIACETVARHGLTEHIRLLGYTLPCHHLDTDYDALICNALLHHLADPLDLWRLAAEHVRPGGLVYVMDLARPADEATARSIVEREAADEAEVLKTDFYHSLLAAYTITEVEQQLAACGLAHLSVCQPDDNHLLVHGQFPII